MNFFQNNRIAILGLSEKDLQSGAEKELRRNLSELVVGGDHLKLDLRGIHNPSLQSIAILNEFSRNHNIAIQILTDDQLSGDLHRLRLYDAKGSGHEL